MRKLISNYKNLLKIALVVPIICFFVIYGCQSNSDDEQSSGLNYSGEEIFKGIFFLQGDLPNQIEALKANQERSKVAEKKDKALEEFNLDFSAEIIKQIKTIDPTYFSQFKKQMESKNYFAMQLAMSNATKMIKAGGYKSKYSGYFKLSDKLEFKKADLKSKEFKDIDTSTPEGLEKYKSLIKVKYDIDVDDEDYKIACAPYTGFCYVIAVAASYVAVLYSGVAVAAYYVYAGVEFWGGNINQSPIGNVLIQELASKLGSSERQVSY